MQQIYITFLVIGITIPLLSLLFNFVDMTFDFVSFDFLEIDFGDWDIDFLPMSGYSICMGFVIFGSSGWYMLSTDIDKGYVKFIAIIAGYIMAVVTQAFINWFKRHQAVSDSIEILVGAECTVTNRIPDKGFGAVVCKRKDKADISITATTDIGGDIEQGAKVKIVSFDKESHRAIVKPL